MIERDSQQEKKFKKIKISSIAEDWKEIKNILGLGKGKLTYPDFINADGKKALTDEEKIKLFENTIEQIFCTEISVDGNLAKEREKIEESYKNLENELKNLNSQAFNPITDIELDQLIDNLDSKKAPGLDKISNKLLKYVYVSIKPFLLKLFNNSLEHGCYPESFKIALVTMLHKTGKPKNKALSYRPLSLTSCIGKILEKLLTNRIKKMG